MSCWRWPPPRREWRLAVAIPGSVLTVEQGLLMKTVKAGIIGRLLAVFRVDEVAIFKDPDTRAEDASLLAKLLRYQLAPPHLKKKLFPLSDDLKYAGVLQPLRTYSHDIPEEPAPGALVYGLIESCRGHRCKVFLGRMGYGIVRRSAKKLKPGEVVLVRIVDVERDRIMVEPVEEDRVNAYMGFKVLEYEGVNDLVEDYRSRGFAVVATSKFGECKRVSICGRDLLLVFGGPWRGLLEYTDKSLYDDVVNTVWCQGVLTVRTEEALAATLAIYNVDCTH